MAISVFDLFSIGIGPSSSHTVGPMRAALLFINGLKETAMLSKVKGLKIQLYGSLGATGKGHGSDKAVLLGLLGEDPETVDIDSISTRLQGIRESQELLLFGQYPIRFDEGSDLTFYRNALPYHPNGMIFSARDESDNIVYEKTYYSIGGGFVVDHAAAENDRIKDDDTVLPFAFSSGDELLALCKKHRLSISQIMLENELVWHTEEEIRARLLDIWQAMNSCIERGCHTEGILPGGLNVKRRAAGLYKIRKEEEYAGSCDSLVLMDWVNLFALAVNEENAAGGRVVTAPTNGAAGIIPAVLSYFVSFCDGADDDAIISFLLTAGAIGILFKENASISGAEVGCQGEVGSACAMAAGGLAEVLHGTPEQVENAAEIGMEHNLGLTCDPVGALVQIPCIERNAMASVKAINAARLALKGDGSHFVSLDKVIKTMRDTGRDMKDKYKETSRGGLAVNVIEC